MINAAVPQTYAVAGKSDDALDEVLRRVDRIAEDDDVATVNGSIGKHELPGTGGAEAGFIDQQVVADQQGVFHGAGWNAEGLDDKGDDEQRDGEREQGKLQMFEHVPKAAPRLGRRGARLVFAADRPAGRGYSW